MIVESLQMIKNAEKEAQKSTENAKTEADNLVKNAGAEAERLIGERIAQAKEQAEKMRGDAERDAQEECRNIGEQWNKGIERIREDARQNLGKAREFILQALLG